MAMKCSLIFFVITCSFSMSEGDKNFNEAKNRFSKNLEHYNIPSQCKGKDFCPIKPSDYPQSHIDKLFKEFPEKAINRYNIKRMGLDNSHACKRNITYQELYAVRDKQGNMRTVVQSVNAKLSQKFRLVQCLNVNSSCDYMSYYVPPGIETFCREKTTPYKVLVLKTETPSTLDDVEYIFADLPVSCYCLCNSYTPPIDSIPIEYSLS